MIRISKLMPMAAAAACLTLWLGGSPFGSGPGAYADPSLAATAPSAVTRRISEEQYRQIIADVFGTSIKVGGRFEPEIRRDGLLAVGAGQISVTPSGLEQYATMAHNIAGQVVSDEHRRTLLPCKPADARAADDACAKRFLADVGRYLFRRPLKAEELDSRVAIASSTAKALHDFYAGLSEALSTILVSPNFLFRKETVEPDPEHPGQYRLDGYSKASQLSFFLWNSVPDRELLAAAEKGDLNARDGLDRQVDRMIASPRLEAGVRAFFSDMLGFDEFSTLSKDPVIYPKFGFQVIEDAREQTLRTIVDHLLRRQGDYRDLFTTPNTFLTARLGSIYGVPVVSPDGWPDAWVPYAYPQGDPRAGILAQVSFVAIHAHPGRSSPTLRGKALRELVLCQKVPSPPPNVNFTLVNDVKNSEFKTARERLTAHRTEPTCAGCHKIMDPIGLGMENFDSDGEFRLRENGVAIDTSGELDGMKFTDPVGLDKAVHDDPATPACLVNKVYAYAAGRDPAKSEAEWMKSLGQSFAEEGYKVPALLKTIATSDELYRVGPTAMGAVDIPRAKLASGKQEEEQR
ncbi:MAG TPA: DUF1592 domain-containing protein [Alphaproteobacteria bacterium]|nr:DUF1592 domain-containing protein [Alphaproteobacteria bacterium]